MLTKGRGGNQSCLSNQGNRITEGLENRGSGEPGRWRENNSEIHGDGGGGGGGGVVSEGVG